MDAQQELARIQSKIDTYRFRLEALDRLASAQAQMPFLWVERLKVGLNSVTVQGDAVSFGDAAGDPSSAGHLQRNGTDLRWHNGTAAESALGGGFWMKLGSTTLGSVGATVDVTGFTSKKYMMVLAHLLNAGASLNYNIRVGSGSIDTGANYCQRRSIDGAADATSVNQSLITLSGASQVEDIFVVFYVINESAREKLFIVQTVERNAAAATSAPSRVEVVAKWVNTANPIDQVRLFSTSGNYAAGSSVVVLGND